MSKKNDGGPAFPVADYDPRTFTPETVDEMRRLLSGMSLRAYMAANVNIGPYEDDVPGHYTLAVLGHAKPSAAGDPMAYTKYMASFRARLRVIEADALIAELERDQ